MKTLSEEIRKLLDKLYNLRSKDSVVLKQMEDEKKSLEETRDKSSLLKVELENKISKYDEELATLNVEGEKLKDALLTINKDEFNLVLNKLNIDFNPDLLKEKVERTLPLTIEKINLEKKESCDKLHIAIDEINNSLMKISEIDLRKDEIISCQERLNKYFEMALSSNINITRDEITDLLSKFDFNEYEKREAAKLLMFPEDGLFDYELMLKNGELVINADEEGILESQEEQNVMLETVEEPLTVNIEEISSNESEESINLLPSNPPEEITKESLISFLTENDFDYLDFTANDFESMLKSFDRTVFKENINEMKKLGISNDIFVDNISLFYDRDLIKKIEKLISIGKTSNDLYLNPSILLKYKYDELNEAISLLSSNGLDPKSVPLMAF